MALQEVETRVSPVVNGRLRETVRGRSGEAAARSEGACTAPGHRNEPEGRAGRAALRDATREGGGASCVDALDGNAKLPRLVDEVACDRDECPIGQVRFVGAVLPGAEEVAGEPLTAARSGIAKRHQSEPKAVRLLKTSAFGLMTDVAETRRTTY